MRIADGDQHAADLAASTSSPSSSARARVIEALAGISFPLAVLICGVFMVVYVVFGGMLATTWVQIIKA